MTRCGLCHCRSACSHTGGATRCSSAAASLRLEADSLSPKMQRTLLLSDFRASVNPEVCRCLPVSLQMGDQAASHTCSSDFRRNAKAFH